MSQGGIEPTDNSTRTVLGFVEEGKFDLAAAYLFAVRQSNPVQWFSMKEDLLHSVYNQKSLQMMALLLEVSSKQTLSESVRLIPGLFAIKNQQT